MVPACWALHCSQLLIDPGAMHVGQALLAAKLSDIGCPAMPCARSSPPGLSSRAACVLQVWLQEFCWTEKEKAEKLEVRGAMGG